MLTPRESKTIGLTVSPSPTFTPPPLAFSKHYSPPSIVDECDRIMILRVNWSSIRCEVKGVGNCEGGI